MFIIRQFDKTTNVEPRTVEASINKPFKHEITLILDCGQIDSNFNGIWLSFET